MILLKQKYEHKLFDIIKTLSETESIVEATQNKETYANLLNEMKIKEESKFSNIINDTTKMDLI